MNHILLYTLDKCRYTLADLENQLPWEREIMVNMIWKEMQEDIERKKNG